MSPLCIDGPEGAALWERVRDLIREHGDDPDELLARAAANIEAQRAWAATATPAELEARLRESARAFAEEESRLRDDGSPIDVAGLLEQGAAGASELARKLDVAAHAPLPTTRFR